MKIILSIITVAILSLPAVQADELISKWSDWKYYDLGSLDSTNWKAQSFNDAAWSTGNGGFAYNDSTQISTTLRRNDTGGAVLLTAYFRKTFTLSSAQAVAAMSVDLRCDDGAVLYINGTEVLRKNMPSGTIAYSSLAPTYVGGTDEDTFFTHALDLAGVTLNSGTNTLAVEVHQQSSASSDQIFDLSLDVTLTDPDAPYFLSDPILGNTAQATNAYSGSLAPEAEDPNADPLFFSKTDGSEWLSVSANGALSGTPSFSDIGTNLFTVAVADNQDGSDSAQLQIVVNQPDGSPPPPFSATRRIRLVWADDPSSSMTIGWEQTNGTAAMVHYGTNDWGRLHNLYPLSHGVDRVGNYKNHGIDTQFVRLTGLQPDTAYYFVLKDITGTSQRYWFRTASNTQKPFTFVAGGDSRTNHDPRRKGNRMVAKLRPLFIAFTGDMINSDTASLWNLWLDDWQESFSADGRIFPLLPHLGNHESGGTETIYQLFDTPPGDYYALSFGDSLLRYYALNSEVEVAGAQASWLENDLQTTGTNFIHKAAGYHRPIRPHYSAKAEQDDEYAAWAHLFHNYGVGLVTEADSHVIKRTYPVRPSTETGSDEGFIRDDADGTVFIGEGCWGAPLRSADDDKNWTAGSGVFYGFDWISVFPEQMEVVTVKFDGVEEVEASSEGDILGLPPGIKLWQPASGTCMVVAPVQAAKESFVQWQIAQWPGEAFPSNTTASADYDGDGYNNMVEFFYGLDPWQPDIPDGTQGFPAIHASVGGEIGIDYRRKANTLARTTYQMSTDLSSSWRTLVPGADYSEITTTTGNYEQVAITLSENIPAKTNAFFRILTGTTR